MTRTSTVARATGATLALAIALAVGCGVPTDEAPLAVDDGDVPFGLLGTGTTTPVPTTPGPTAGVCLVRDGTVHVVDVAVPAPATPGNRITAAATALRPPGYATALDDESVIGVRVAGPTATVSLGPAFRDRTARDQLLAVGQITCTLTLDPAVARVLFTVDGTAVEVPRGDGSTTAEAVTRDDYRPMIVEAGATTTTGTAG